MRFLIATSTLIFINIGCVNNFRFADKSALKKPSKTDFCGLADYSENKLIKVKAVYSGFDEYWSLHGKKDCDINYKVNFDFNDKKGLRNKINGFFLNRRLKKVHDNGARYAVEMELTGHFEKDLELGFGHLGRNKYQISAKKVRILKFVKKNKGKKK